MCEEYALDGTPGSTYGSNVRFTRKTTNVGYTLAIGLSGLLSSATATAFTPQRGARDGLELADGSQVRPWRAVTWNRAPARATRTHAALVRAIGATETIWDAATGVPMRVWGAGVAVPGSVAQAGLAARAAGEMLRQHIGVLAPGSKVEDFVRVGNDLGGGIRSVGFRQHHRGRPVLGGQLSFRFKADRLVMIGSEALPNVQVALTDTPISAEVARARAVSWLASEGVATAGAVEGPFILPIVGERGVSSYHEVVRVTVEVARSIGRHDVYLDAATGAPVAREQMLRFASGQVRFNAPRRGPQGERTDFPAPRLDVLIDGVAAATDMLGGLMTPDVDVTVGAGAQGALVRVTSQAGDEASKDLLLTPGGTVVWNAASDALVDAQLAAFIHASIVKEYVRGIAPDFGYLDKKLQVKVNIDSACNAFSDGDTINFFQAGGGCENTGRIADIVYHEFGHSVHQQSLIPGVGAFDGAVSEGISDYLSATITDDSALAPGFFLDSPSAPLRQIDPQGDEHRWPDDLIGQPHEDGLIIAGTLWDLRELLRAKLGDAQGTAQTDKIWFESIRRAGGMPSMYPEALLADDDDGDLGNGTPNECEINKSFYLHGLLSAGYVGATVSLGAGTPAGTPVALTIDPEPKPCIDIKPVSAVLRWRVAGTDESTDVVMDAAPTGFAALLPAQPDDTVLEYQVLSTLLDESQVSFPVNLADPWYQLYHGPVTPLYCTGFEGAADIEGWTLMNGWEQGTPTGKGGDPGAAFSGTEVAGVNLDGTYSPGNTGTLTGPVISTEGFAKVRLQYRRWLGVEDAFFDQATIRINGLTAWQNFNSDQGDSSNIQHTDLEWRFHDIDITPGIMDGAVQVAFRLKADEGLEMAGWNVDELCVVGVTPSAAPGCGDGVLGGGEDCDDGNTVDGDGCSASCEDEAVDPTTSGDVPTGGGESNGGESTGSAGDSSSGGSDESGAGALDDEGCGCRSTGGNNLAALGLGLLVWGGLRRRRVSRRR